MKKIYLTIISLIGFILLMSNKSGRAFSEGEGSTGAPGEPTYCKNCHNGDIQVTISSYLISGKDTVKTYEPDKSYTIHVIVKSTAGPVPKGYGFQLVGLLAELKKDGPDVKSFTANSNNVRIATASSTKRLYAEHLGNSSSNTFIVNWQSPAAGSGPVSFYVAGMGNNANNDSSGDGAAKISVQINEKVPTNAVDENADIDLKVFPNPGPGIFKVQGKSVDKAKSYTVFDLLGKPIFSSSFQLGSKIDLTDVQDGIYIVQWYNESKRILRTQKLIKRNERP